MKKYIVVILVFCTLFLLTRNVLAEQSVPKTPTGYDCPAGGMLLPLNATSPRGTGKAFGDDHAGLDYNTTVKGNDPLQALANGRVVRANMACGTENCGNNCGYNCGIGLGNYIVIQIEGTNDYAIYAHLSSIDASVSYGTQVKKGQVVGNAGNTGNSDIDHLHLEMRKGAGGDNGWDKSVATVIDPYQYLTNCNATMPNGTLLPKDITTNATIPLNESGSNESGSEAPQSNQNPYITGSRVGVEEEAWYKDDGSTLSDERYIELFEQDEDCDVEDTLD